MGLSVKTVRQIKKNETRKFSLESPGSENIEQFSNNQIEDKNYTPAPQRSYRLTIVRIVRKALYMLDYREREIILLRFGFYDGICRTLDEVGKMFGITKERVRQIEIRAIDQLRLNENLQD